MKDRKGNVGIIVSVNTGGGTPSASLAIADKNGDIVANNTAYTSVKLHLGLAKLVEAHSTCY